MVVAIAAAAASRSGDEVVPNPDPVWELQQDDLVLLLGTPEQLAVASRLFEPSGQ